jgi:stress response protein SCP2
MFSKVALVALAAGAQMSFAAPVRQEERSLKAVGTALVGGAASLLTGAILNNKREESGLMVDTETGVLYMEVPDANEGRSLKAIGTAVAGGIASGVAGAVASDIFGKRSLTAIENFIGGLFNKRSEPSGLMVDTETGVIYMDVPDANEGRSLKAIGTTLIGGAASLLTGAILNNKRQESGLMVDTDTGVIYADIPDLSEGRSLKAIGTAIAGGVASGVAGAVASDIFGKREPASGLMVDTESGVIYMEVPDANQDRSLKAIGTAVAGGIASGVAGAVASDIFGKREPASSIMVDTETGVIYADVPDANEGRSLKAIGTAVAGGIASGVAGAVASDIFGKREPASGIMVDTETGVIYADVPDANEGRSLKAIGTAVAGGIASGVAGAVASDIFNKREELSGLMVDTETGTIFMDVPDAVEGRSLQAIGNFFSNLFGKRGEELDARSLTAIENFFGSLFNKRGEELDSRSLQAIGNFFSSLFNKRGDELDARSLTAIENFFGSLFNKRDGELDARSLTAIENFFSGLFNKRSEELDARSLTAIENFFGSLFNKRGEELDARSLTAIENFLGGLFNKRSELEENMAKRSINDLE